MSGLRRNDDITVNVDEKDISLGYIKLSNSHFKPNAKITEIVLSRYQ